MKRKTTVSPYSMMYLVTPAIYEKLLLCIDEGDKKLLDNLNNPPDENLDRRPAQIRLDALSSEEIKPIVPLSLDVQPSHDIISQPEQTGIHNVAIIQQPPQQQQQEIITPVIQPQPQLQQQQLPITVSVAPPNDTKPSINIPVVSSLPQYQANVKPVNIIIPSNVTQPAAFSQPASQQIAIDPSTIPLPPDDMMIDDPSLKRPLEDSDHPDNFKRQRTRGNIHYERDIKYKQNMLQRIQDKKNQLKRPLTQWQPLQCVSNTTGGQICNPDPINQPSFVQTDEQGLIRDPGISITPNQLRVRDDLLARPHACKICGVNMGNNDLLLMHYRLKHKMKEIPKDENIMSTSKLEMPGLDVKPIIKMEPKIKSEVGKTKPKRRRFLTPGFEPPISPFVYNSNDDTSFRQFKTKKDKRKRFKSRGNEPQVDPFVYDPDQDVSFRKPKATKTTNVQRQPLPKANKYRCPICEKALTNITLLKQHIISEHNENPNDVIKDMASNMLSNPQPGSSRDFTNWTSIRTQPPRAVQRRREFGKIKKTTSNFEKWD